MCILNLYVISGFQRSVIELFSLLECYTALIGSQAPTFWITYRNALTLEDGTDRLSRNFGNYLQINAA